MRKKLTIILLAGLISFNLKPAQAQGLASMLKSRKMNQKGVDEYLIKKVGKDGLYYSASLLQGDHLFADFRDVGDDIVFPKHVGFRFQKMGGEEGPGTGELLYPRIKSSEDERVAWADASENCKPYAKMKIIKNRFRGNYYYYSVLADHKPYWGFQINEDGSVYLVRVPPVADDAYTKAESETATAGWMRGASMLDFDKIVVDALYKSKDDAQNAYLVKIKNQLKDKVKQYVLEDDKEREKNAKEHMQNTRPDPEGMKASPVLKKMILAMGEEALVNWIIPFRNDLKGATQLDAWCIGDDWTPVNNGLGIPEYHYIWTEHIFKTTQNVCYLFKMQGDQKYSGGGTFSGYLEPDKVAFETQRLVQVNCDYVAQDKQDKPTKAALPAKTVKKKK